MTKRFTALLFFSMFFCGTAGFSNINRIALITLTSDQQILLMFDGATSVQDTNQLDASHIINTAKELANKNPNKWIELSFDDPAVYDTGINILPYMSLLARASQSLPENCYVSMLAKGLEKPMLEPMILLKGNEPKVYLSDDFSLALASGHEHGWPKNFSVRSNNPSHERYGALFHEQAWLLKNTTHIRMQDLILPSGLLRTKGLLFKPASHWSREVVAKLYKKIETLKENEHRQLEHFANFVDAKIKVKYPVVRFERPLSHFEGIIGLSLVHDFLKQNTKNLFASGPTLDVLLSLFHQHAPSFMIVILNESNADQLLKALNKMGVVANESPLAPDDFIKGLWQSQ